MEVVSQFTKNLITSLLASKEFDCKLVGGVVRDRLLGFAVKDVDFLLVAGSCHLEEISKQVFTHLGSLGDGNYSINYSDRIKDFRTFKIAFDSPQDKFEFDFVFSRREQYSTIAAKPIVSTGTIEDDLARRDFSINAMASKDFENPLDSIIDNFNGIEDLAKKQIKILHDLSFRDDPSRLIRALKFKNRFNLKLESQTERLFKDAVEQQYLPALSRGRRYAEFLKLFLEPNKYENFYDLLETGLLRQIFEIEGFIDEVWFKDKLIESNDLNEKEFFKNFFVAIDPVNRENILAKFPISKVIKNILKVL